MGDAPPIKWNYTQPQPKGCGKSSAWLSLDESDNELPQFLSCFVAALQTLFLDAVHDTMTSIHGPGLPPATVLDASLVNDLERIDQRFVVVLDDIHRIKKKAALLRLLPGR